jgi:LysM repeat protein
MVAGCATLKPATTSGPLVLKPYSTITPSPTGGELAGSIVSAETPLPSPTPSRYVIKAGDTLSQIAERLHVSLDELLLANPGIDPNALRVGESVLVPAPGAADPSLVSPTPVALDVTQVACRPMATGAAWCFALVHNDTGATIENVTGQIAILDSGGNEVGVQQATLLLDILPQEASLPFAVVFDPPLPLGARARVRLSTAMRVSSADPRYLPASTHNVLTAVSWSGRTASVSGDLVLEGGSANASSVWIAAVAYDEDGRVVGWRRWESTQGLAAGASQRFDVEVYSLAGRIHRVELVVEARP